MSGDQTDMQAIPDCIKDVSEGDKNTTKIHCLRCPCVVLIPNTAQYKKKKMLLPHMKKKSENQAPEDGETLTDFWMVGDMYAFENVGFSKTVGTMKYLVCADCEVGPIGFQDLNVPNEFYVAVDRVKHG